jgi:hypothetical protein
VPTVLRQNGYRFSFYSYDLGEPIHVHVTKAGREAKIWLSPIRLEWNDGFRQHELRDILKIVEANKKVIKARWHERKNQ